MATKRKLLSVAERVNIIFGVVEDAMTRLTKIAETNAQGRTTDAVRFKREEEVRHELRRSIENLVRARGRDVLELLREYVVSESMADEDGRGNEYQSVFTESLLAVIDAGFMAEDDAIPGERCPNCERAVSEHSRVDLYGAAAIICLGAPRLGIVVTHPEALSKLVQAATTEAQRQFDEMTKGSEARANAEDYAAIMDTVASLPDEQLGGIAYEGGPIAGVVAELLKRGAMLEREPILEREKLERVFFDALTQLRKLQIFDSTVDDIEAMEQGARMLVNLLKGIFPVRVEYFSQEEVERVERARREPAPIYCGRHNYINSKGEDAFRFDQTPPEDPDFRLTPTVCFPPMQEGQTHWLIGSDYGIFYSIDAEGKVARLENEYTRLDDERRELPYVQQTSNMRREYKGDDSTLTCSCGSSVSWKGFRGDEVNAWIMEHMEHDYTTSEDAEVGPVLAGSPEPSSSE